MTQTAQLLVESLDLSDAKVDRDSFVIRGVKLGGRRSRNKHRRLGKPIVYSDNAIQQEVTLFDEMPVTVRGAHNRALRDYTTQNGVLRTGRTEHLGTEKAASRFDWHLNSSDPLTPKILEDAEKFPGNCPLSLEVMEWTESVHEDGYVLIESLTEDKFKAGVALVYRGGLNDSLFESAEDQNVEIKTKEELAARFPALCEELTECACQAAKSKEDELQTKLTQAIAEREAMKSELEKLKGQLEDYKAAEERVEHAETIVTEAKKVLGEDYEVSEQLMEDLLALWDGEGYKRILTSMGELISREPAEAEKPTSTSGLSGTKRNNTAGRRRVGIHNRRF